jgi:hypothetical protein
MSQVDDPPRRRRSIRLRGLMLAVPIVAVALALVQQYGGGVAMVGSLAGLVAWPLLPRRLPRRGRAHRAARDCAVAGIGANLFAAATDVTFPHMTGLLILLVSALPLAVAVLGAWVWWLGQAISTGRGGWKAPLLALPLVLVLAAGPGLAIFTRWPARGAFRLSRSALETRANRVAAGRPVRRPEWAGLFRIVASNVDRPSGNVALIVNRGPAGRAGFLRLGTLGPPSWTHAPYVNYVVTPLDGSWCLLDED